MGWVWFWCLVGECLFVLLWWAGVVFGGRCGDEKEFLAQFPAVRDEASLQSICFVKTRGSQWVVKQTDHCVPDKGSCPLPGGKRVNFSWVVWQDMESGADPFGARPGGDGSGGSTAQRRGAEVRDGSPESPGRHGVGKFSGTFLGLVGGLGGWTL